MRISVKVSLIAVVGVLVALLIGQGLIAYAKLASMRAAQEDITHNWMPAVEKVGEVKYLYNRLRTQAFRHLANTDEAVMSDVEKRMEKNIASLVKASSEFEKMTFSAESGEVWKKFKENLKKSLEVQNRIIEMSRTDKAKANSLINDTTKDYDATIDLLDRAKTISSKGADTAEAGADETYASGVRDSALVGVLALLTGIGAGVFVVLGVTSPLRALTEAMGAVSRGRLETEIPSTDRANEIGDIARTLVVFRDGLAEAERLRAERSRHEAETAEHLAGERHRIADRFMATMGGLAERFVRSSGEVATAARNLSATAEETADRTRSASLAAEESSANVRTVGSSAEELTAAVREIDDRVARSTRIADTAAEEVGSTEANIRGLSEAAERIGDVVELIRDIAGQTNLLALNATIEAARAGEAGKGFAVVASEVKQLAAQTAKATDEIAQKIGEIQSATNETVTSIGRIVDIIGSIREMTQSIAHAVGRQAAATGEITGNTARATEGASLVASNMVGVGRAAEVTGVAAGGLLTLSGDLSAQADELTREVRSFVATLRSA
ncbi:MAG: methyl-accepting chemotaxis protein [Siculibacillus sp.]|nr:methyl-accepting chemotaxis protein [Siculibacillus sp.]